ncbi:hypothetical protein AYI68_g7492 [Smittium mucronatum]|uniref:Uncharacterized protein n=1 Tax=Smittium mucronatum TaxID=133383 RepID=A0A1R0GNL5_9FUNG|nr:hypothetical protein AYI68_g7492 [Smittium mucronatum]
MVIRRVDQITRPFVFDQSQPIHTEEQISFSGPSGSEATEPPKSRQRTSHYQSARLPKLAPPRNLNVSAVVSRQSFTPNK